MGGFGSGRPRSSRRGLVDDHRSIDVNRLRREGCLRAGWVGCWEWSGEDKRFAVVDLRAEQDRLHLAYRVPILGGGSEDIIETIGIERVPCRFGGTRPYFVCPGVVNGIVCGRRVAKLLHAPVGRYFLCRRCYRLSYASQSEGEWDRAIRRGNKIKRRLGGIAVMGAPLSLKPKGMWRCTHWRLLEQAREAEVAAYDGFTTRLQRLLTLINARRSKQP